jgi:ABC-type transporter Mla subunit MlaD
MSLLAQDERLTRRVGAITLVVLAVAIVFFVFIYDQIDWGSHTRIKVYFQTTGGLREGASFVVAGKEVGRVESIALVPRGTNRILGNEDGVEVKVAIHTRDARRITHGGDVFVTSRGALSGKYLEIAPAPQPQPGDPPPRSLREGDEIRGADPPSLDRVLQRTWDNMTTAAAFAAEVRPELNALTAEVDGLRAILAELAPGVTLATDIEALVTEAKHTYAALGGEAGIAQLAAVLERTGDVVDEARATIAKLRASSTQLRAHLAVLRDRVGTRGAEALARIELAIDRVRAAADKIDPLLAHVEALRVAFVRGDGSLLKLMRDPEFPEDAKDLGKVLKRQPWKIISRPPK